MIEGNPQDPKQSDSKIEEKRKPWILQWIREEFDSKDPKRIREVVDNIQRRIQRGGTQCTPMPNHELEELMTKGEATLYVGTGTSGQRIFIKYGPDGGELWMPFTEGLDAQYGLKYHLNFEYTFEIPEGEELRVSF